MPAGQTLLLLTNANAEQASLICYEALSDRRYSPGKGKKRQPKLWIKSLQAWRGVNYSE